MDIKAKAYTLTIGEKTFAVDCPKVVHEGSATILPNHYNDFGTVTGEIEINFANEKPYVANNYIIRFVAGENVSIVFGAALLWHGGSVPTWTSGKTYEISIIEGLALWVEV